MQDNGCLPLIGIIIVLMMASFWLGATIGKDHGKYIIRTEAVKKGLAEWVVDQDGYSEWRWKDEK